MYVIDFVWLDLVHLWISLIIILFYGFLLKYFKLTIILCIALLLFSFLEMGFIDLQGFGFKVMDF